VAARELRALQLDPQQAQRAADFYEAYAEFAAPGVTGERLPSSVTAAIETLTDDERADVASALRLAGQWAALFDLDRGQSLLMRSALIWGRLGHGFGSFLLGGMQPRDLNDDEVLRRHLVLLAAASGHPVPRLEQAAIPAAMLHPQQ